MKYVSGPGATRGVDKAPGRSPRFSMNRLASWVANAFAPGGARQQRPGSGRLEFESLEPRLLLSDTPFFTAALATAPVDLTLRTGLDNNNAPVFDLVDNSSGGRLGRILLADLTAPIRITGSAFNDRFTLAIDPELLTTDLWSRIQLDGAGGADGLHGSTGDLDWTLSGPNSGTVAGIGFQSIEALMGTAGDDNFIVEDGVGFSGAIDGGLGDNALLGADQINQWRLTGANAGTLGSTLAFANIGSLVGGNNQDDFVFDPSGSLSGLLDGGAQHDTLNVVDTIDYSAFLTSVTVDLGANSATRVTEFARIGQIRGGSNIADRVQGPATAHVQWNIAGVDQTRVQNMLFTSFENLRGAGDNSDIFTFETGGSISGLVEGGSGGEDGMIFNDPASSTRGTVFNPAGTDSGGTAALYDKAVGYAGMDRQEVVGGNNLDRVIRGTLFNDSITLRDADAGSTGQMTVSYGNLDLFDSLSGVSSASLTFDNPLSSLTIEGRLGKDVITVESLDSAFAAQLLLYGNLAGAPPVVWDLDSDTIAFTGSISTGGAFSRRSPKPSPSRPASRYRRVTTGAMRTTSCSVRGALAAPNSRTSHRYSVPTARSSIDIGTNATLDAGSIYLIAQAEDRSFASLTGASNLVNNFAIGPLVDKVAGLLALPVKVLVKLSEASVVVGTGAKLLGDGAIGVYATATSDATGTASGSLFSIGYSQAQTKATVDIQANAVITGGNAVVITSNANATADIEAKTERDAKATPNPGSSQVGLALAGRQRPCHVPCHGGGRRQHHRGQDCQYCGLWRRRSRGNRRVRAVCQWQGGIGIWRGVLHGRHPDHGAGQCHCARGRRLHGQDRDRSDRHRRIQGRFCRHGTRHDLRRWPWPGDRRHDRLHEIAVATASAGWSTVRNMW
jgi:hypothetical protein